LNKAETRRAFQRALRLNERPGVSNVHDHISRRGSERERDDRQMSTR
jgi:hypothetical protein